MKLLTACAILLTTGALARAQSPVQGPRDDLPDDLFRAEVPLGLGAVPLDRSEAAERRFGLGRRLFFDPVLSSDRSTSCASCHDPAHGFASATALPAGVRGRRALRNAPTVLNRGLARLHSWDGRAASLEEQVLLPISNPNEMDLPLDEALTRLTSDPAYSQAFQQVFAEAPSSRTLAAALSGFVGRLWIGDSPVDRFRAGDSAALTPQERAGFWIYESKGRCWRCHSGPNFSDERFHNTGVGAQQGVPEPGRAAISGLDSDRGRFKTPTLRGLAATAPYMHDGSVPTLEAVVEHYRRGGEPNSHLAEELEPLDLTEEEAASLVDFLEALSRRAGPEGRTRLVRER